MAETLPLSFSHKRIRCKMLSLHKDSDTVGLLLNTG